MAPHPPVSILVIDDEPSLVRALARLLQRDGYVVATARNGRHALAALQSRMTVTLETFRISAVSSTLSPPKYRSSTT